MDIVQSKKARRMSRKTTLSLVALSALVAAALLLFNTDSAAYLADRNSLLIDTVQRGDLHVRVRGNGVLVPKDIRWITTDVPARVERIVKRAGAKVQQGDVLMELANPQLQQQLLEAQWELQALEAETLARRVSLESDLLDQEIAVVNESLNHQRARLTLEAQEALLGQGIVAISKIDYEEVRINVAQYKQQWELEQKRLQKRQENLQAHMLANEARLSRMRKVVQRIQEQVDGLRVKASMDSIVQDMPLELGQQVSAGSNLALLARSDLFIAQLRIPEKQIKDVLIGQPVTLDTRTSQIQGKVLRIDPAVVNSSVQIDVELSGELPKEVRPELTVDGEINIATIPDTLFVRRPMYASSFSQSTVYRLDPQGQNANQQPVTFGHMSSQFIQVQAGLNEGDSIIVSDASGWAQHQQIGIN
ncbi:efflux RND transporter periplasmic adaptor subunit [Bowmanella denitrificans]|uniref:efflux RND transporter periplasmic adaptor subunit n=1 Tax=Bowmanella denitrificans TaxID=366582 RepID=UPI000C9B7D01|nr:HlyD family efflux transporter periplasmic adaptor subunit [Bowmanella denitrificans]